MSVASCDPQTTFAATLVDEWVRAGITDAVVCPGSRSTPLTSALHARAQMRLHVRLDERSAGFFALGLAAALAHPVVVCTTSGTAAAELHASVVEAHHARVPLVVCTADRPPELHHVGAPQTIEQDALFGAAVRWSVSPGVPDPQTAWTWRALGARLVAEARDGPSGPGPVHCNLAFRDPLVGTAGELPPGRREGLPWHTVVRSLASGHRLAEEMARRAGGRGLLVVGAGGGDPQAVLCAARLLGWPVLADPRSGCRLEVPGVVAAADALARCEDARRALSPEFVVVLGAGWASEALGDFLADASDAGGELAIVDPWWRWQDPRRSASLLEAADPTALLAEVTGMLEHEARDATWSSWSARWQRAEDAAQAAMDAVLQTAPGSALSEPALARLVLPSVPPAATVVVSSSMPVRELEWYGPKLSQPPRVWANRGANGIDGVTSTALGFAAARGGPVVGLLGDLAFFHDAGALARPAVDGNLAGSCTLVVVDNGGGGIFSFLPQASAGDRAAFERLFATPMATPVLELASGLGARVAEARSVGALQTELARLAAPGVRKPEVTVLRAVVPDREENVALHERLHATVAAAVDAAL